MCFKGCMDHEKLKKFCNSHFNFLPNKYPNYFNEEFLLQSRKHPMIENFFSKVNITIKKEEWLNNKYYINLDYFITSNEIDASVKSF